MKNTPLQSIWQCRGNIIVRQCGCSTGNVEGGKLRKFWGAEDTVYAVPFKIGEKGSRTAVITIEVDVDSFDCG